MAHTILITGATGRQGGETIRALLDLSSSGNIPITIHALVRNPSSEASKALASLSPSVKLFTGHFDDPASIQAAAKSCTGVFVNVMPSQDPADQELRHARNILAASKSAGTVTRAVYSSASIIGSERAFAELDRYPGTAFYMRSKKAIEDEVLGGGFSGGGTVLRPAFFFTNFTPPHATFMYPALATHGELRTALDPDLVGSFLDPADIGRFAARALVDDGDAWRGKVVPLASAHWTIAQAAEKLTQAVGGRRQIKAAPRGEEEMAEKGLFVLFDLFQNEFKQPVDLDEVRSYGIELGSWEDFAERNRKAIETAVGLA
ncbi:putative nad dependent epimerase dehydratase protein [Neofusicoccum parvum UCRNP2]|uniref:Putative nad dependent epimerase dehydratase protein n=1 Tax=Botryosphaeria parva (strain UCR-NP2) TaxID=1287680 RepID=R1G421_BOTPV|nr:putative nad dependent epimerase dehydratase protein [Neofusicoccum parvum UCRNP2]